MEKKEIGKLRKLYRAYLTDDIKRDMYVNGADEKLIDLVEAEEVEEEDLYKFLNQLSVLKKFIKWLVENDKIRKDIYRPIPLRIKATYEDGVVYHDKLEDRIIMLLSISDTPIEDLISYLHE